MTAAVPPVPASGLLVVDKPSGLTSHDVVARVRRAAGTRRVGHAGTLDPMATGVLVVGVERATRLLGHLMLTEKRYLGTAVLGATTSTDDAEGELLVTQDASALEDSAVRSAAARLVGVLTQVPPAVSAIKVDGKRAYARVRAGEDVVLASREVTVHALDVLAIRHDGGQVEVDVDVRCSSGTYIRALARDLGAALGVGGHLGALRRTAVGPYDLDVATPLADLHDSEAVARALLPLAVAARAAFPSRELDDEQARVVSHGGALPPAALGDLPSDPSAADGGPPPVVAVFAPDGALLALVQERDGMARPLAVFVGG